MQGNMFSGLLLCSGMQTWDLKNNTQFLLSSSPPSFHSRDQERNGVFNEFSVFVHSVDDKAPNLPQGKLFLLYEG